MTPRSQPTPTLPPHEIKIALPSVRAVEAGIHLGAACTRDHEHPSNEVCSVYFDTPDLKFVREKIDSHYLKTKIRIRWYEALPGGKSDPSAGAVLEVKRRIGSRRVKKRLPLDLTTTALAGDPLGLSCYADLPRWLATLDVGIRAPLRPLLMVRYRRHRFVEPSSASRIALDDHIRLEAVDSDRLPAGRRGHVDTAVVEVKGSVGALPQSLRFLWRLGGRRMSFSKYGACYDLATGTLT